MVSVGGWLSGLHVAVLRACDSVHPDESVAASSLTAGERRHDSRRQLRYSQEQRVGQLPRLGNAQQLGHPGLGSGLQGVCPSGLQGRVRAGALRLHPGCVS